MWPPPGASLESWIAATPWLAADWAREHADSASDAPVAAPSSLSAVMVGPSPRLPLGAFALFCAHYGQQVDQLPPATRLDPEAVRTEMKKGWERAKPEVKRQFTRRAAEDARRFVQETREFEARVQQLWCITRVQTARLAAVPGRWPPLTGSQP